MLKNIEDEKVARETMLVLMPTASTLAGLSIGLVSIVNTKAIKGPNTVVDDLFLFAAIGFLAVCYLIFFAMRRLHGGQATPQILKRWAHAIDFVFLGALTLMVIGGVMVVYELG